MRTAMSTFVRMPLRHIILFALFVIAGICFYYFWNTENSKFSTLVGGISGGLIVYIIGFIISIYEYRSIDRFRELGIRDVLPNRRVTAYYAEFVGSAKDLIVVTGTSCTRFIDDFADDESDEHVLIDALRGSRKLQVQFMVPSDDQMDAFSKSKFTAGEEKLRRLISAFPGRVEMKRSNYDARYSFVRVDNELIVGPVFIGTESKNSPAIRIDVNSSFAEKYLNDFNRIWNDSQTFV